MKKDKIIGLIIGLIPLIVLFIIDSDWIIIYAVIFIVALISVLYNKKNKT